MKNLTTTCFFLSVLLSSCSHYYYVPNVQNVPLFREKNEYRISGSYGFGDESSCAEVQAAYSVSDKIGIMTDFMSAKGGTINPYQQVVFYQHRQSYLWEPRFI